MYGPGHILIAGVGNELLSDDGVGIHAVRELQKHPWPGVVVVEIGTDVLRGLPYLEHAARVLVIDAAWGGKPPGTLYLFEPTENRSITSLHSLGLREAARVLTPGHAAPPMTVLGVEPGTFDYGMELSDPVRAVLPRVVALARETVTGWLRRAGADQPAGGAPGGDADGLGDHSHTKLLCRVC